MPTLRHRSLIAFSTGVALTLVSTVVFTAWRAEAVGDGESTFVPLTPCRLVDTRPASQVGPKSSPVGPSEEYSLQVTGAEGECSISSAATAVAINLTAVAATAPTFVAIYPANEANPGTSALNVTPGQPPTPNKVDVQLSPDGKVKLFNKFGSVHIIGDVLGYYRNDGLAGLEARLAELEAAQPFAVSGYDASELLTATDETVVSVEVTAPVDGHVTVNSATLALEFTAGDSVRCSITTGTVLDAKSVQQWQASTSPPADGDAAQLAGTRRFEIAAQETVTYNLVCSKSGTSGDSDVFQTWLTAIFTPAP